MPEMPQSEIDALGGFRFLANKYGGSPQSIAQKIESLEEDNRKYRQVEKPEIEARLPKDGEVVIAKGRLDELEAYEKLGKPTEIEKALEKGRQAALELATISTRNAAVAFAKAAGLADEAVDTLIAIPALKDAKFEIRKGKVKGSDGKEVDGDVPYLTLAGENQSAMTFEKAGEAVPALKGLAKRVAGDDKPVNFVPQGSTPPPVKDSDGKTAAQKAIEANRARASAPNALRPSAPAQQ